jgi:hypothetical protein
MLGLGIGVAVLGLEGMCLILRKEVGFYKPGKVGFVVVRG